MAFREKDAFYKITSEAATVADALKEFDQYGNDLDAILVTDGGTANERIRGIVTPYDVPRLIRESLC